MKLGRCEAWNFGSYAHLELDLSDIGLSLVYGKTGSGKSTIPDVPCWVLFGVTSKNGAADDVRSWSSIDAPTKGVLDVQLHNGSIQITRIRGKAGQNDLYWTESNTSDKKERGKDLSETQRYLCNRLGVDAALYLSASYFCDFSSSGHFFTAKAKDRRELFEKIAKLDLPIKIAEQTSENRKKAKKELESFQLEFSRLTGKLEQLEASLEDLISRHSSWEDNKNVRLAEASNNLAAAHSSSAAIPSLNERIILAKEQIKIIEVSKPILKKAQYDHQEASSMLYSLKEEHRRLVNVGPEFCPTCLSSQDSNIHIKKRFKELSKLIKSASADVGNAASNMGRINQIVLKEGMLQAEIKECEALKTDLARNVTSCDKELAACHEENPFAQTLQKVYKNIQTIKKSEQLLKDSISLTERRISSLGLLYDMSFNLRGELLKKAVREIEAATNSYLEKYFDAEIRVNFSIEGSDDLTVNIQKSGFSCSFKQLSKGQRQLLKLCFAISIMKASSNSAGIHFDNLFFDEALDGMDESLKIKAYDLFCELSTEHKSIMVIEHAESFQNMFCSRYRVDMVGDNSQIEVENA